MTVTVSFSSDGNVIALQNLQASLDTEEILDEVEAVILNRIRTRFLDEEGPTGKWQPSKAGLRRRAMGGTGTLFASGTLFHSIQAATRGSSRVISTDVPYAAKHQFGEGGEVQREFMYVTTGDLDLVQSLISKRIKDAVG